MYEHLVDLHRPVWLSAVQRHRLPVPYRRIATSVSEAMPMTLQLHLPWALMLKQLSFCKLRCGLVPLGHLSGRKAYGRSQQCMNCDAMVSNLWVHAFGECIIWTNLRNAACRVFELPPTCRSWDITYEILSVLPVSPACQPFRPTASTSLMTVSLATFLLPDTRTSQAIA